MKRRIGGGILCALVTVLVFWGSIPVVLADIRSRNGLTQLISESPLICAGEIESYRIEPKADKEGGAWEAARFALDHPIKGHLVSNNVDILICPTTATALPQTQVHPKRERWLLFLKPTPRGMYELAGNGDGVVWVGKHPASVNDDMTVEQHVEVELLAALESDEPLLVSGTLATIEMWRLQSRRIGEAVDRISRTGNPEPRARAISMKIRSGDLSALSQAISHGGPDDILVGVGASIADISDPAAIPNIVECAGAKRAMVRQGAIHALRIMANRDMDENIKGLLTPVFRAGLADTNRMVQYDAMWGVAGLQYKSLGSAFPASPTNMPLPAFDEFLKNPDKYLYNWRQAESPYSTSPGQAEDARPQR